MNIVQIGDAIDVILRNWNSQLTVIENIVEIVVKLLTGAQGAFAQAALKYATLTAAGLANLANGQAATVDTITIGNDKYSLVVVKDGSVAAQALGL